MTDSKDISGSSSTKENDLTLDTPSASAGLGKLPLDKSLTENGTIYRSRLEADYASLCMLSYNRPQFLKDSLRSLADSPGHPYELIIHDDGSETPIANDHDDFPISETEEILLRAQGQGATIILNRHGHNQGQGIALNRMFQIAKGDPIIKLDQDLRYHPGWLMEVARLMNENPSIGLLGLLHYYHEPVDSRKTVKVRHDEWSEHTHILGSAFAMRRACWEELGPFDEHSEAFAEDYVMQRKVDESGKWKCSLPKESLVENLGMGIPHSTVVEKSGGVHPIHKTPFVIYTK
jgi:cellulose synthase/poly-beta-1,6-N-acetylglucosamine synthase-like glycosyltransferase